MKTVAQLAITVALFAGLSACEDQKVPERQAGAGGEILERSVSDDMLPYDTVRSQPPLVSEAPEDDASGDAEAEADAEDAGD